MKNCGMRRFLSGAAARFNSVCWRAFVVDGVEVREQPLVLIGSPEEQEECCGGGVRIPCVRAGS
jgi:hypothetical protein